MDKELIVVKGKVIEQTKGYHAGVGKDIGYEAGAKMVKRHFDENPDDVVAHFIGRNLIEAILAQPGCVGLRTFQGLNNMGIRQLVYVGVDKLGNNIINLNSSTNSKGIIASDGGFCPPYCGTATETSESDSSWW